jgi:hypothetical protein
MFCISLFVCLFGFFFVCLLFCCCCFFFLLFFFCSLFCHVLIQCTASDYSFGIFKYFVAVMLRHSANYYSIRPLYIHSMKYMYKISDKIIICLFINAKHCRNIVKLSHEVTSIRKSAVLKGHIFLVLS